MKRRYICKDGPMVDVMLHLDSPYTLVFTLKGLTGRYVPYEDRTYVWFIKWESHG